MNRFVEKDLLLFKRLDFMARRRGRRKRRKGIRRHTCTLAKLPRTMAVLTQGVFGTQKRKMLALKQRKERKCELSSEADIHVNTTLATIYYQPDLIKLFCCNCLVRNGIDHLPESFQYLLHSNIKAACI